MLITRRSPVTGLQNTMSVGVSPSDVLAIYHGVNIRSICPRLTEEEYVFYTTGLTVEEQQSHSHLIK